MRDLYERLKAIGIDRPFVIERVLPDWWEDSLASVPANRFLAEAMLSKSLGIPLTGLRHVESPLPVPTTGDVCFKKHGRTKDASQEELGPLLLVCQRLATIAAGWMSSDVEPFGEVVGAKQARESILESSSTVNLASLVDFCWRAGVGVLKVPTHPKGGNKFAGMTCFVGERPLIVVASRRKAPPWLAFIIAHELGHVMLGHVKRNGEALVDIGDAPAGEGADEQELGADAFALHVLRGESEVTTSPVHGLTATKLARKASELGPTHGIDPGVLALMYGFGAGRMPVGMAALKHLQADEGADKIVISALTKHIDLEHMPEESARFLGLDLVATE